jgi:hypothetical protein
VCGHRAGVPALTPSRRLLAWRELLILQGGGTDEPIILAAASIQARLARAIGWLGIGGLAAEVAESVAVALLISQLRDVHRAHRSTR